MVSITCVILLILLYQNYFSITSISTKKPTHQPTTITFHRSTNHPTVIPTYIPTTNISSDDPVLVSVQLNMNYGNLSLIFDRDINASTFDFSYFLFIIRQNINITDFMDNMDGVSITNDTMPPSDDSIHTEYKILKFQNTFNNIRVQGNSTSRLNIFITSMDYSRIIYYNYRINGSLSHSMVSVGRGLIQSTQGFTNRAILLSNPLSINYYVSDTSQPFLKAFSLDMNNHTMKLEFSEPVDSNTFSLHGIALQMYKNAYISGPILHLINNNSYVTNVSNYHSILYINIELLNSNNIKSILGLCVSSDSCYLSAYKSFVSDYSNNTINLIAMDSTYGLAVKTYIADTTPPTLSTWTLDINRAILSIQFSETVYVKYFNYSAVSIVNHRNISSFNVSNENDYESESDEIITTKYEYVRLSMPISPQIENIDTIRIILCDDMLNKIKAMPNLCKVGSKDCYIVIDSYAIADTATNQNLYQGIDATYFNARPVSLYIPDKTSPQLLSYGIDLTKRTITFHFSETVNIQSIDYYGITLQSESNISPGVDFFTLSPLSAQLVSSSTDSSSIIVYLKPKAYSYIRSSLTLFKSIHKSYISIEEKFITDMAYIGNPIVAISKGSGLPPISFIPDYETIELVQWSFNLINYVINMTFSGPIDINSIHLSDITLTSDMMISSNIGINSYGIGYSMESYQLLDQSSFVYSDQDSYTISIQLNSNEIETFQSFSILCRTSSKCYLSYSSNLAVGFISYSISNEAVYSILLPIHYMKVYIIVLDNTIPALMSYTIDMNNRIILFQFSKVVKSIDFNVSTILFYNIENIENIEVIEPIFRLTYPISYDIDPFYSINVTIAIGFYDYLRMVSYHPKLFSSINNTYVTIASDAVTDVNGNFLSSNLYHSMESIENAIKPSVYIKSQKSPLLLAIYRNTLNNTLKLYFDDLIDDRTVDLSSIRLTSVGIDSSISLLNATIEYSIESNRNYSSVLSIELTPILSILTNHSIGINQKSIYVYLSKNNTIRSYTNAIGNMAMLSTNAIGEGNTIVSFRFDMTDNYMELEFSVPVTSIASITTSYFQLCSKSVDSSYYTLTGYNSYELYQNRVLRIYFTTNDIYFIQLYFTSIMSYTDIILKLTSPNAIIFMIKDGDNSDDSDDSEGYNQRFNLSSAMDITCNSLYPDTVSPTILSYSLNFITGYMEIVFSKVIDGKSIRLDKMFLVNSQTNYTAIVSLSQASYSYSNSYTFNTLSSAINKTNSIKIQLNVLISSNKNNTLKNEILSTNSIGRSVTSTYLLLQDGYVADTANPINYAIGSYSSSNSNGIVNLPIQVGSLVIDSVLPTLVSFDLNLTNGILTLHFDKDVNISSNRVGYYTLVSDMSDTPVVAYEISYNSTTVLSYNSNSLYYSPDSLSVTSNHSKSVSDRIEYYSSNIIYIQLSVYDMDNIITHTPNLCYHLSYSSNNSNGNSNSNSISNCYIALNSNSIKDISGNSIVKIPYRYAVTVKTYTIDLSKPKIVSYGIDMTVGKISVVFNKPIVCSSINIRAILLQSNRFIGKLAYASYTLTESSNIICYPISLDSKYTKLIDINLSYSDSTAIKATNIIAKGIESTYLRIVDSNAIEDVYRNTIEIILDGDALQAMIYDRDFTRPKLLSYSITSYGLLYLYFSKPMDIFSLSNSIAYSLSIQNSLSNPTVSYILSHTTYVSTNIYKMIFICKLNSDFDRLRMYSNEFNRQTSIYLTIANQTIVTDKSSITQNNIGIKDIAGNSILPSNALELGPAAIQWNLNLNFHLNRAILSILFSENILLSSDISIIGITIQSNSIGTNLSYTIAYNSVSYSVSNLNSITKSSLSNSLVSFILSNEDVSILKVLYRNNYSKLYLSIPYGLSQSIAKDSIFPNLKTIAILKDHALPICEYTPDRIGPTMISFGIDISKGNIELIFDEPINIDDYHNMSIDIRRLDFVSNIGSTLTFSNENVNISYDIKLIELDTNSTASYSNRSHVWVVLDRIALNHLKTIQSISSIDSLYILSNTFYDYSNNGNVGNDPTNPIDRSYIVYDIRKPIFEKLVFDMCNQRIILLYDEIVDIKHLYPMNFSILSSPIPATNYSDHNSSNTYLSSDIVRFDFSEYTIIEQNNMGALVLDMKTLHSIDYFRLESYQRYDRIATNLNNSYLFIDTNLSDVFGNSLWKDVVYQATEYIPDISIPILLSYDILDTNLTYTILNNPLLSYSMLLDNSVVSSSETMISMRMYFSKPIRIETFYCSAIGFQSMLSNDDDIKITKFYGLYDDECYILNPMDNTILYNSSNVIDVILTNRTLHNTFYNNDDNSNDANNLNSYTLRYDSIYMTIVSNNTIKDIYGITLQPILSSHGLRVGPRVINWLFDINTALLVLSLSKPINISYVANLSYHIGFYSTIDHSIIYLAITQNTKILTLAYPTLSGIDLYMSVNDNNNTAQNSSVIGIYLNNYDINKMKYLKLVTQNSIYLVMKDVTIYDYLNVPIVPIPFSDQFLSSIFIADNVLPTIVNITFNLGLELVIFEFSEPIDHSSFDVTAFTIQAYPTNSNSLSTKISNHSIVLSTGSMLSFTDMISNLDGKDNINTQDNTYFTVTVSFSFMDAIYLKFDAYSHSLAYDQSSTYVSYRYNAFKDISGNYAAPVESSNAIEVNRYIKDIISPVLQSFTLDMSSDILLLKFSEPILYNSIHPTNITLQSRFTRRDGSYYQLTGGTVITYTNISNGMIRNINMSTSIEISLSNTDINEIKSTVGLARGRTSTYLTCLSSTVTDLFGNPMIAITDGNAIPCSTFVTDIIYPTIVSIELSLDSSEITFTLSEPVVIATVYPTALTFQSTSSKLSSSTTTTTKAKISYTLSSLSYVLTNDIYSNQVIIKISSSDLNELKTLYPLLSNINYSYVSYTSNFMTDVYGNPISTSILPIQVTTFISDITKPSVVFYGLNMVNGIIELGLNEIVNIKTINFSQLTIQNSIQQRFGEYIILSDSIVISIVTNPNVILSIELSSQTFIRMKYYGIGYLITTSYLIWGNMFIEDYYGNYLLPKYDGSALNGNPLEPSVFIADNVAPNLLRWYIDIATYDLLMIFDEPITIVNIDGISLITNTQSNMKLNANMSLSYDTFHTRAIVTLSNNYNCDTNVNGDTICLMPMNFVSLTIHINSIADFSIYPNYLQAVSNRPIGSPDCNGCTSGYYVSTLCSSRNDSVCSPCSSCDEGTYTLANCSTYLNTQCQVCSNCQYGYYTVKPCTIYSDTICQSCDSCNSMQYHLRYCTPGFNTICGSCEKCTFPNDLEREECLSRGQYQQWALENCCTDDNGKQVSCFDLTDVNVAISMKKNRISV